MKRKVVTEYIVVLKDKHGNEIASFPYNEKTGKIGGFLSSDCVVNSVYELDGYDTTDCIEKGSDLIVDHSARQRKKYKK